jgi:alkylation response protein AidB-like acyl-CoA dehydrogenase
MDLLDESLVPDEIQPIKENARRFSEDLIKPAAAEHFQQGRFPSEIIDQAFEQGVLGKDIPEDYGGGSIGTVGRLAIMEELFRGDGGIGLALHNCTNGIELLVEHGTEEQKSRYLEEVAAGDSITGLAVSEPETGSDLGSMSTEATKKGGQWILNGEKYWIGNGVEADYLTVYAKTGDNDASLRNYSLFIVPSDSDGFFAEHIPDKIGLRASKQGHLVFDDCRIPESNIIGSEGAGLMYLTRFFNHDRIVVAGHALGLAAAAIEATWEFTHERNSYKKKVSDFQSVQHKLAEMRAKFEAARALTYRAAKQVERRNNPEMWAACAKMTATRIAGECAEEGMLLHGGRSILSDRRIARIYCDVRGPMIYEGTNDIQKNIIYRTWG